MVAMRYVASSLTGSPFIDRERASRLLNGAYLDPEVFAAICSDLAEDKGEELFGLLF